MIPFARATTLRELAARIGGDAIVDAGVSRVAPVDDAGEGDLAPLTSARYARSAHAAVARGAALLVDASLAPRVPPGARAWTHPNAPWALACALDLCEAPAAPATWGEGTRIGANVSLFDRVVLGARVTIAPGCVIGAPGFGWAHGPNGEARRIPQLGGVVVEDDVELGAGCTIDAGTLSPTRIRRGAKLDAQVHVGHNAEVGEGSILAAQCGLAGSVVIGRGVLVGGQAGFADHVRVGDGARVAAKSGVIGDVPPGAVVAGYPAQPRARWLRALARTYRGAD